MLEFLEQDNFAKAFDDNPNGNYMKKDEYPTLTVFSIIRYFLRYAVPELLGKMEIFIFKRGRTLNRITEFIEMCQKNLVIHSIPQLFLFLYASRKVAAKDEYYDSNIFTHEDFKVYENDVIAEFLKNEQFFTTIDININEFFMNKVGQTSYRVLISEQTSLSSSLNKMEFYSNDTKSEKATNINSKYIIIRYKNEIISYENLFKLKYNDTEYDLVFLLQNKPPNNKNIISYNVGYESWQSIEENNKYVKAPQLPPDKYNALIGLPLAIKIAVYMKKQEPFRIPSDIFYFCKNLPYVNERILYKDADDKKNLLYVDFCSLESTNYIHENTIDFLIEIYKKKPTYNPKEFMFVGAFMYNSIFISAINEYLNVITKPFYEIIAIKPQLHEERNNETRELINFFKEIFKNKDPSPVLYIPISTPGHWILLVVDRKINQLTIYDSLNNTRITFKSMQEYKNFHNQKKDVNQTKLRFDVFEKFISMYDLFATDFPEEVVTWKIALNSPIYPKQQQQGSNDCGAFVLEYMLALSDGKEISDINSENIRTKLAQLIIDSHNLKNKV